MPPINVDLVLEKETKNKVRFVEASGDETFGTIYVPKRTWSGELGGASRLSLSLAPTAVLAEVV